MASRLLRRFASGTRNAETQTSKGVDNVGMKSFTTNHRVLQNIYDRTVQNTGFFQDKVEFVDDALDRLAEQLSNIDTVLDTAGTQIEIDKQHIEWKRQQVVSMQLEIVAANERISKIRKRRETQRVAQLGTVNDRVMNMKNEMDQVEKDMEYIRKEMEFYHKHDVETVEKIHYIEKQRDLLAREHHHMVTNLQEEYEVITPYVALLQNLNPKGQAKAKQVVKTFIPLNNEDILLKNNNELKSLLNKRENLIQQIQEQRREKDTLTILIAELQQIINQKRDSIQENKWHLLGYPNLYASATKEESILKCIPEWNTRVFNDILGITSPKLTQYHPAGNIYINFVDTHNFHNVKEE